MSVCFFDKRSERAELIRETALIIWDQASMMNRLAFEVVNHHLKDICDYKNPFGGKLVVLEGDFRQNFQWLHMAVVSPLLLLSFIGHPFGIIVMLCIYV